MTLEDLIDELAVFLDNCKATPFSAGKVSVPKEEFLAQLEELKMEIPSEVERSREIVARKDMIIAEAQAKADSITANAQKEADQIVANAESNLSGLQKQMDSMKAQFFSIREQMNSSVALLNDQFGQVEASLTPAEEPKTEAALAAEPVEEIKAEHPLKAILEQASAVNNQKKNFFR